MASVNEEIQSRAPSLGSTTRLQMTEETEQDGPRRGAVFESYPDGGVQAWLQVFHCFCIFFTTVGGIYCWGVFQDALFSADLAPASTLSFIGSTQATLQALFAIPIARLVASYGNRNVALVGAALSGLGPILAGWCTGSVPGMIITEGLIFGFGQAMCFHASATLPANYFLRKRNLATGLVYAGGGAGGAALAILANALIKSLGLPWAFRIIGIVIMVINLPSAYFINSRASERTPPRPEPRSASKKIVDVSLFKNVRFSLIFCGTALGLFPLFVPPFFLPLFGTSIGLSSTSSSLMLAGFNLASAFGRIGFGLAADSALGSNNAALLCMTVTALSTLAIWPIAGSVAPLALFAVITGLCSGGFFSLMPGLVGSIVNDDQFAVAFSMVVSSWSPAYFLGAPIAGYILQAFGDVGGYEAFRPAIFYSGGLSTLSAGLILAARLAAGGSWKRKV